MMKIIKGLFLLFFGLLSLGSGLCTLGFTPAVFSAPGILFLWLPGLLLCIGSFFAARAFYLSLTEKPKE